MTERTAITRGVEMAPTPAHAFGVMFSRTAMTIIVGAAVILLIVGGTTATMWRGHADAIRNWQRSLGSLSLLLAEHAHQTLSSADLVLRSITEQVGDGRVATESEFRQVMASADIHRILRDRTKGLPQIDVATIVALDGDVLNFTRSWPAPPINLADRDYVKAHLSDPNLELIISAPVQNRGTGRWTFYIARKIKSRDGQVLGLALAGIESEFFANYYRRVQPDSETSISLLRRDGNLLARFPEASDSLGKTFPQSMALQVLEAGNGPTIVSSARMTRPDDTTPRMIAPHGVEGYPLIVSIGAPETLVLRQWQETASSVAAMRLVLVLCVMLLVAVLVRMQRAQLARRNERKVSQDAATRHAVEIAARDEREQRLQHEARVKDRVSAFNGHLNASVIRLGSRIEEIAALAERMTHAASLARSGSEGAANASVRTAEHIGGLASAAEAMSTAGEDIAVSTFETVRAFREASEQADRTDGAVAQLAGATAQIDAVTRLIKTVADQTNLLALNATIEAARAGEAGRGFAVVASEIKTLASRTATATSEISRQVAAIQTAGDACVDAMQRIRQRIHETQAISDRVSGAVEAQTTTGSDIARAIRAAAGQAVAVSAGARSVTAAAEATSSTAQEVVEHVRRMNEEARRIRSDIEAFIGERSTG